MPPPEDGPGRGALGDKLTRFCNSSRNLASYTLDLSFCFLPDCHFRGDPPLATNGGARELGMAFGAVRANPRF